MDFNTAIFNSIITSPDILYFAVTLIGVFLLLFSGPLLVLYCFGKTIAGPNGRDKVKIGGYEIQTNYIVIIFIASVATTVMPLYLLSSGQPERIRELQKENIELESIITELKTTIRQLQVNNQGNLNIIRPDPVNLVDLSGRYDYRSTPHNRQQGPLFDERGNEFYQFIGEIDISRDHNNGNYSIKAHRHYCVSLGASQSRAEPKFVTIDHAECRVQWTADSNNVYLPQSRSAEIIFSIVTRKVPPNQGIIKGKLEKVTADGKAEIIEGDMVYLIPISPKTGGPHWMMATMILQRKGCADCPNHFAKEKVYKKWFKDHGHNIAG